MDTELYEETNEKDSWGPRFLWPTRRFRVNFPEKSRYRKTGRAKIPFDGRVTAFIDCITSSAPLDRVDLAKLIRPKARRKGAE